MNLQELRNYIIRTTAFPGSKYYQKSISTLRKQGKLHQLYPGFYVKTEVWNALSPQKQHLLLCLGLHKRLKVDHVFSHESAALLWGLQLHRIPKKPHVHQKNSHAVRSKLYSIHCYQENILRTKIQTIPVTTMEMAVIDCARTLNLVEAVTICDSAYRQGMQLHLIENYLESQPVFAREKIRYTLSRSRALSESPGESFCRVVLEEIGMRNPQLQYKIKTHRGTYRVDFAYPKVKLIVEFDGKVKYNGHYGHGKDILFREKQRHDALVEAGWTVIRLAWDELYNQPALRQRFSRYIRY